MLVEPIPNAPYTYVCNFGKPSYGNWITPKTLGVNPLTSKKYFPGAHAYGVKPEGAKQLVYEATSSGKPTDVYLHTDTFSWLQEYYPWPAEARDNFTTIQNVNGCLAKHNYNEDYEISDV